MDDTTDHDHQPAPVVPRLSSYEVISLDDQILTFDLPPSSLLSSLAELAFVDEAEKLRPFLHLAFAQSRQHLSPSSLVTVSDLHSLTLDQYVGRRRRGFSFHVVAILSVLSPCEPQPIPVLVASWTRVHDVHDQFLSVWKLKRGLHPAHPVDLHLYQDEQCTTEMTRSSRFFVWRWAIDGPSPLIYARVLLRPLPDDHPFTVKLKNLMKGTTGRGLVAEMTGRTTVRDVKQHVYEQHGIASSHQIVKFRGEVMEDERFLDDYDVKEGSTLHLHCTCVESSG
jgi:hypothetical protein